MSAQNAYKCPNCGGHLEYDGASSKIKCPYCDSFFSLDEVKNNSVISEDNESFQAVWTEETSVVDHGGSEPILTSSSRPEGSGSSWKKEESSAFGIYNCSSCGAELICSETTAAMRCPYCDNVIIFQGLLSGELKPDIILPFRMTREQAVDALSEHLKGKKLLPKVFTAENHINEVKGVYVPFWLYNTTVEATATYKMTNVRTWSDRNYIYTETSHFQAERDGSLAFEAVPVDGLKDMANDLMESIETFDVTQAVPFRPEYLTGYYANRYDVSSESAIDRAIERMTVSAAEALDSTVRGYATVTRSSSSARLTGTKVSYALFPVWILNTTWRGKNYLFAMNGQSGKFVGNLPMDTGKYWLIRGTWTLIFSGAFYAFLHYFGFV